MSEDKAVAQALEALDRSKQHRQQSAVENDEQIKRMLADESVDEETKKLLSKIEASRMFSEIQLVSPVVEFIGKPSFEVDENGLETKTQLVSCGIGSVTLKHPKVNHRFSIQVTVKQTKSPEGEMDYSIESHPLGAFRVVCDPRSTMSSQEMLKSLSSGVFARHVMLEHDHDVLTTQIQSFLNYHPIQQSNGEKVWIEDIQANAIKEVALQFNLTNVHDVHLEGSQVHARTISRQVDDQGVVTDLSGEANKSEALREELEELEAEDTLTEILQARCGKDLADEILQNAENKVSEHLEQESAHHHERSF